MTTNQQPAQSRLSVNPRKSPDGKRPMKRAKRPYKSKGKPRALLQSENSRHEAAKNNQARTTQSKTIHARQKKDMLKSHNGLERARVLRVLLAGASAHQVAQELKIPVNYCSRLLKDIENDCQTIGKQEFISLLWRKFQGFMDDHTAINGSLELLLYQVDTDLRELTVALERLSERITAHRQEEPPAGEAYNIDRATWQATGKALDDERQELNKLRQALRIEKTALQKEKRSNNKDLVEVITKMGVTTTPPVDNNKVPAQSPVSETLPMLGYYKGLGEGEALEVLERGISDMSRYLRDRKKRLVES